MTDDNRLVIGDLGNSYDSSRNDNWAKCGSPNYRAPEIYLGLDNLEKCDVWSLGCIVYYFCTLNIAFTG